jgi:hypothetical protein
MSAIVYTPTPFIDKMILQQALQSLHVTFREGYMRGIPALITEREDYYGAQAFVLKDGCYALTHDSSAQLQNYPWRKQNWKQYKTVAEFISAVEKAYNQCLLDHIQRLEQLAAAQAEAERQRIENERIAYIEAKKTAIIAKAKAQGYDVREKKINNTIQLVLIKNTY